MHSMRFSVLPFIPSFRGVSLMREEVMALERRGLKHHAEARKRRRRQLCRGMNDKNVSTILSLAGQQLASTHSDRKKSV